MPPLVIKLRCSTWGQVQALHERDLKRNALFLRTPTPVPLGREIRVDIVMPSGTVVSVEGRVAHHVTGGDRGAGLELVLTKLPPSALWLIESALARATPSPAGAAEQVVEDREAAAAEEELLSALDAELRAYRGMTSSQILQIPKDSGEPVARASFGALSKRYHPDRFARYESERLRALAAEIFVVLHEAYQQIADEHARPPVRRGTPAQGVPIPPPALSSPAPAPTPPAPPQPPTPPAPRRPTPAQGVAVSFAPRPGPAGAMTQPMAPVRSGTPVRGVPAVTQPMSPVPVPVGEEGSRPVVTFNRPEGQPPPPPVPEGGSGLSADDLFGDLTDMPSLASQPPPLSLGVPGVVQADALLDAGRHDEAIAEYEKVLRAAPTDRAARSGRELALGLKLIAAGDRVGAAERFEAALEIEPWGERAARELATLRRGATERGKGLLAKLLGRGGGS